MADVKREASFHDIISRNLEQLYNSIRLHFDRKERDENTIKALVASFYSRFITPQMEVKETIVLLYDNVNLGDSLDESTLRALAGLLGARDVANKPKEVLIRMINHIARSEPDTPIAPAGNPKFVTHPHTFLILVHIPSYAGEIKMRSIMRGQLNGFSAYFESAYKSPHNYYRQTKDDQAHGWALVVMTGKGRGSYFEGLKQGKWIRDLTDLGDKGLFYTGDTKEIYYIDDVEVDKEVYDAYANDVLLRAAEYSAVAKDPLGIVRNYLF